VQKISKSIDDYVQATSKRFEAGSKKFYEIDQTLAVAQVVNLNRHRTIMIWLILLTILSLPFRIAEIVKLVISFMAG
jgi:hypothetical protein